MDQNYFGGPLVQLVPLLMVIAILALVVSYGTRKSKAEPPVDGPPLRIGGWLAFYIFCTAVVMPLALVLGRYSMFAAVEDHHADAINHAAWTAYKDALWLVTAAYVGVHWWVDYGLLKRFERPSVTRQNGS